MQKRCLCIHLSNCPSIRKLPKPLSLSESCHNLHLPSCLMPQPLFQSAIMPLSLHAPPTPLSLSASQPLSLITIGHHTHHSSRPSCLLSLSACSTCLNTIHLPFPVNGWLLSRLKYLYYSILISYYKFIITTACLSI